MCLPDSSGAAATPFSSWAYKDKFDAAPGTSTFATGRGSLNDEMHIAVVDSNGEFSGTKGTVLETYPFVSVASNAKNTDGSTNYSKNIVNNASNYIWMAGFDSDMETAGAGGAANNLTDFKISPSSKIKKVGLGDGKASSSLIASDYARGFDTVEDVDKTTVDFLIAPQSLTSAQNVTVVNDLVSIAQGTRKDCVVVASPARNDAVGNSTPVSTIVSNTANLTKSSYLFMDNNYLKVYDKYNDKFIFIPAASSTAGIMSASDFNAAPWFSPAGQRRGQYLGITDLSYSPTKAERDSLYKAGVNLSLIHI